MSVGAALVALTLISCTSQGTQRSASHFVTTIELNEVTGTITLPLDRFMPSATEQSIIRHAQNTQLNSCMSEIGLSFPIPDPLVEEPPSRRYGIWTEYEAERLAFLAPEDDELVAFNALEFDDVGERQLAYCADQTEFEKLQTPALASLQQVDVAIYSEFLESNEAASILADWRDCLRKEGLTPGQAEDPYTPIGYGHEKSEREVGAAVKDVRCKRNTRFVERMANEEAELQIRYIEANLETLESYKTAFDEALTNAKEL